MKITRESVLRYYEDSRARRAAIGELGEKRVIGSLGLLREAVARRVLTPEQAFESYRLMIEKGGYLPKIDDASFFAFQK